MFNTCVIYLRYEGFSDMFLWAFFIFWGIPEIPFADNGVLSLQQSHGSKPYSKQTLYLQFGPSYIGYNILFRFLHFFFLQFGP